MMQLRPSFASLTLGAGLCLSAFGASAATATFDGLSEGFYGNELVDGGIRFFNPDNYVPGLPASFSIDRADGNLGDDPFFSSPNGLAMEGYVPGPDGGGNRFGGISIALDDGTRARSASVELFINLLDAQNHVLLVALLDGVVVASDSTAGPIGCCDTHRHLELGGAVFDTLRLFGTGPFERGAVFMLLDNVTVQPVPVPPALLLLGSALLVLGRRYRAAMPSS